MTKAKSSGGLPTVGIECRDDGNHNWRRTGAGREENPDMRKRGARYFRTYECQNGCGCQKTRRMDAYGCFMSELARIHYTDPDYLVEGGVDKAEMGLLRLQEVDPNARVLRERSALATNVPAKKAPAKKTAAKKAPAKKVTAKKVAEVQPMKRASERKPAARTSRKPVEPVGGRKTAAKQPTSRRAKQSA